jgi:hypothetical protein
MPFGRIRLAADQLMLATSESDPGATIFEPGIVQSVPGLVLRKARIKDLSVNTIQLKNESVTVPASSWLGSDFDAPAGMTTFLEHNIVTRGVAGSLIYVQLFYVGFHGAIVPAYGGLMQVGCWVNSVQVIPAFPIAHWYDVGEPPRRVRQRVAMTAVTATGAIQTINVQWRAVVQLWEGATAGRIYAGTRVLSIAMKR